LAECYKFNVFRAVLKKFCRIFRTDRKLKIEVEARRAGEKRRVTFSSLRCSSGQSYTKRFSEGLGVRGPFALREHMTRRRCLARVSLWFAAVVQIQVGQLPWMIRHL
jgi:hypothetical protein